MWLIVFMWLSLPVFASPTPNMRTSSMSQKYQNFLKFVLALSLLTALLHPPNSNSLFLENISKVKIKVI